MTTVQTRPIRQPSGTVTFLFSDIEGSTRLVEALGDRYGAVLQRHREAMRSAFAEHGGVEQGTEGDSFFVAFADAREGVAAAVAATRRLAAAAWPEGAAVRVRIGLHTGKGRLVDDDYVGLDVHRAARIAAAGHGGQILVSQTTRVLVDRGLPLDVSLRDMGEHRLKDLPSAEHLYQVVIAGQPDAFPSLRSLARTVANLPAQLPAIVGRDAEVAAIRTLLGASRLVTVTGPGGTGKTRLVQEIARAVVHDEPIDAAFVPLEAVTDADHIAIEIIRALRLDIAVSRDPIDRLVEHFADRRTLLVLDNLEQLPGAGVIVRALLDRAAAVAILVASQAPIHVAGEHEFALGPLALPPAGATALRGDLSAVAESPAVRLFIERARAVRADFDIDADNAAAIVAISARLDGLPLAIELAAAQSKLLSPDAILERIGSQLDALTSRRGDLPARQRTLRATVTWSYELLPEPERRLFRRLSVFAGGARLPEIEALAAAAPAVDDAIACLETLVDRSLVTPRHTPGGDDRFALLEAMRAFGGELLRDQAEGPDAVRAHAEIYRQLARQAEPELYRADRRAWLDRLANDHDNIRAALDALEAVGDLSAALDMSADLWRFWQQRGHLIEGRDRLDRLLAAAAVPGAPPTSPIVLSRAEEAAGSVRYWTGDTRESPQPYYERSLEQARIAGDRRREAWATYNLAFVFDFTAMRGVGNADLERATALRSAALERFREIGDDRGIAESLWAMGGNALIMGEDPGKARELLRQALERLQALGDAYGVSWVFLSIGMLEAMGGNLDEARDAVLRATDLFQRDGDVAAEIVAVQALASLAARDGDDVTAVRNAAAADAAARDLGAELPRIPPIIAPIDAAVARMAPNDLARERAIGEALGARSILSAAIETWQAGSAANDGSVQAIRDEVSRRP